MSASAPSPGAGPAVEISGLTKWFGDVTALDRVDFRVERGRLHGLVGANGAGKSTLLSVIFGLIRPDEGVVRVLGRTRRANGRGWLDGVGGFVEAPRFYPYLSGRANLQVLAGLDAGDSAALIDPVLELVGLGDAAARKVKGYSLGMRQRLGLASAIIRRPALLVLDEPMNGLDPVGIRNLGEALRAVGRRGVTIVLSSHDMAQVEQLCSDVTVLDRGTVVFSGATQRLRAEVPLSVWHLRTSDDRAARTVAVTTVGEFPDSDDGLRLAVDQSQLGRLLIALGGAGVEVRSLELAASALESLVLRLTDPPHTDPPLTDPVQLPPGPR